MIIRGLIYFSLPFSLAIISNAAAIPPNLNAIFPSFEADGPEQTAPPLNITTPAISDDEAADDPPTLRVTYTLSKQAYFPETLLMGFINTLRLLNEEEWHDRLTDSHTFHPPPQFLFTTVTYIDVPDTTVTRVGYLTTALDRLAEALKVAGTWKGVVFTIFLGEEPLGSGHVYFDANNADPAAPPVPNTIAPIEPKGDSANPASAPAPYTYITHALLRPPTRPLAQVDTLVTFISTLATLARRPHAARMLPILFSIPTSQTAIKVDTAGGYPEALLKFGCAGAVWVAAEWIYKNDKWESGVRVRIFRLGREAGEVRVLGVGDAAVEEGEGGEGVVSVDAS